MSAPVTKFTVNNQPVEYRMDPRTPLLWALRDASNLTGTKYGCGTGHCGACTVDIDGRARRACQVPIGSIEGSFVTTIEGLSHDRTHPIQVAFLAENVSQCGFCIPGLVMAAAVLLKNNAHPSEDDIRAGITNICRCGVYPRLVEAIQRAGRIQRGDETVPAGPRPGISPDDAAHVVPALKPTPSTRPGPAPEPFNQLTGQFRRPSWRIGQKDRNVESARGRQME